MRKPNAQLPDGTRVRVLGDPFKVTQRGPWWSACEFPDYVVRPVQHETLTPLNERVA